MSTNPSETRMPTTIDLERPDTPDAVALIEALEAHLAPLYNIESRHGYSVEKLIRQGVHFFVLRHENTPAGCGGIQFYRPESEPAYGEVKRMYVRDSFRGKGFGRLILDRLAEHAAQNGIKVLRLETGIYQEAAIRLYEQYGFVRIPPFGDYWDDPVSLCYEKRIE